ncbi:DUF535 family protein [Zoogloea sp.]|jgi:hypothetical protein|uniref:DUF535 family protein n=1 Tax=Zoogloea sp. TaxID=49181 RepID=UPI0037DA6B74
MRIEGYWALCLHDSDAPPLFNLSFGFTAADTLLIASLQKLKRVDGSKRETIYALTKQCHGLRRPCAGGRQENPRTPDGAWDLAEGSVTLYVDNDRKAPVGKDGGMRMAESVQCVKLDE